MNRRSIVAVLVALMLQSAFGAHASGNVTPIRPGDEAFEMMSAVAIGDFVYATGWGDLMTYRLGDERAAREAFSGTAEGNCRVLFEWDARLYGLFESWPDDGATAAFVAPIDLIDGAYVPGDMLALDWSRMRRGEGEYAVSRHYSDAFVVDDQLYILTPDLDYERSALVAFSMVDGGCRVVADGTKLLSVAPYKNGLLLATAYEGNDRQRASAAVGTVDVVSGALDVAFEIDADAYDVFGLAYDDQRDAIYYILNGQLMRLSGLDPGGAHGVSGVSIGNFGDTQRIGHILEDGRYMFFDEETLIIRDVSPDAPIGRRLTVQRPAVLGAGYYAFEKARPDVEVVFDERYLPGDDIVSAIVNRDDSVDIYSITSNDAAFGALKERGCLAPIENADIRSFMSALYPAVNKALTADGQLIAVPSAIYEAGTLTYNADAMQALGLTEEDLPQTWSDMIDFAARWPDEYADEFLGIAPFEPAGMADIRRMFVYRIMSEYAAYMEFHGLDAFDSPVLRQTLEKLDQFDFSGIEVDASEYGYDWDPSEVLFGTWGQLGFDERLLDNEGDVTWLLAFEAGEQPVARMTLDVCFVNPFSKNRDIAEAYLLSELEHMSPGMRTTLNPGVNEPPRERYDEQGRQDISRYRKYAENLLIATMPGFDHFPAEDVAALYDRYIARQISSDQLISVLDQKRKMMETEGY